jgi:hypothetical protein
VSLTQTSGKFRQKETKLCNLVKVFGLEVRVFPGKMIFKGGETFYKVAEKQQSGIIV